jgi:four helix bundle protein
MTYEQFEDLPVWKDAIALAHAVFDLVRDSAFNRLGDLRNQLQRASLSVSNNIAEGFERGTTNELLSYIYISRGSAGETRSALQFAGGRVELAHLKPVISELISKCQVVSRQLRGWAASLQNSDIAGQRRLNEQTQTEYRNKKRSVEFVAKLQSLAPNHGSPQTSKPPPDLKSQI